MLQCHARFGHVSSGNYGIILCCNIQIWQKAHCSSYVMAPFKNRAGYKGLQGAADGLKSKMCSITDQMLQ